MFNNFDRTRKNVHKYVCVFVCDRNDTNASFWLLVSQGKLPTYMISMTHVQT